MVSRSALARMSRRFMAAVVIAVMGATMLLGLAHQASSAHTFCPEHGTLEEAGEGGGTATPGPSAQGASDGEAHDACPFATALVSEGPRIGASPSSGDLAFCVAPLPRACVLPPSTAVYALAPKTSPPA